MTKLQFIRKYSKLAKEDRAEIRAYYESILKNAVFPNTFTEAEQRLLWIIQTDEKLKLKEANNGNNK